MGKRFGVAAMKIDKGVSEVNQLTWKYVKPLREGKEVDDFLKCNNVTLPVEIVRCIKENNGGRPSKDTFDTDRSKERVFKALLSYNIVDKETIYMCYPNVFKEKGIFPIAVDHAGNFICVDVNCGNAIVFFELESGIKEFIADNFKGLLDNMY